MGTSLTSSLKCSAPTRTPSECFLGDVINVGSTSEIRTCGSPQTVVKCVRASLVQSNLTSIREDIKQWSSLKHPNLVQCVGLSEKSDYIYVYLEHCCGGNLKSSLKRRVCTLSQVRRIARDILCGLQYLHARGIVYGVLKPSRVLFQDKKVLLADFTTRSTPLHEQNIYYLSPEALNGKRTFAGDVWTLGVTLYLAITGRLPFNGIDCEEVIQQVKTEAPNWDLLPEDFKLMIQQLLNKNPQARPTPSQALQYDCLKDD